MRASRITRLGRGHPRLASGVSTGSEKPAFAIFALLGLASNKLNAARPAGRMDRPAAFVLAEREETREENQIKDDPKKIAGNGASAAHKNGTLRLMTHP
jgi:hypothetical protein